MKKLLIIAIMPLLAFYGCKKSGSNPTPPATVVTPKPKSLSIVISKLTPATFLSLSLVNDKGVNVLTISGKNSDTTYMISSVSKGDHLQANLVTNISPAPGDDGVVDVKFIYDSVVLSEVSGGIYNKTDVVPVDIP